MKTIGTDTSQLVFPAMVGCGSPRILHQTFPEMEGCFEAQEVIPTGRPGLPVMQYESEAAWFHVEFDLYFGVSGQVFIWRCGWHATVTK